MDEERPLAQSDEQDRKEVIASEERVVPLIMCQGTRDSGLESGMFTQESRRSQGAMDRSSEKAVEEVLFSLVFFLPARNRLN